MEKLATMEAALINNRPQTLDAAVDKESYHAAMTPEQRGELEQRKLELWERRRQLARVCNFRNYQQLREAVSALNKIVTALDAAITGNDLVAAELAELVKAFWPRAKSAIDRLDV